MLEMTLNITKETKAQMQKRIKEFISYLNQDMYLLNKLEIYSEKFYLEEEPEKPNPGVQNLQNLVNEEKKEAEEKSLSESSDQIKPHRKARQKKVRNLKDVKFQEGKEPREIFDDQEMEEEEPKGKKGDGEGERKKLTIKTSYELRSLSLQQKLRKVGYIYLFAFLICCFYTGIFFLSKTLFNEFILSLDYAEIFYERKPCIANTFFMIQMEYFQFEIIMDSETGNEIVD